MPLRNPVGKIYTVENANFSEYSSKAAAKAVSEVAKTAGADVVIISGNQPRQGSCTRELLFALQRRLCTRCYEFFMTVRISSPPSGLCRQGNVQVDVTLR